MNHQIVTAIAAIKPGQSVGIVGSQKYKNIELVDELESHLDKSCIIVTGDAKGIDTAAIDAAKRHGLKWISVAAEWSKYGKAAGVRRNPEIVRQCDIIIAFYNRTSPGTKNSIDHAKRMNMDVYIIDEINSEATQMALF